MTYLIIDTSTQSGAVGVWRDGELVRSLAWRSRNNHTSELMPAIESVLTGAALAPADLQGLAVARGPGGFSALRSGLGAAKGLAFATGIPVVGVSSLEATAYPFRGLGYPVCAIIEAGREAVAWASFVTTSEGWHRRTPDKVTSVDALLARAGRHTFFCGEGAVHHADELLQALGAKAHMVAKVGPAARLDGLAELGASRLAAGEAEPVASLEPHYLRPPGITPPKRARIVRQGATAKRR
jgi:tRNA threonylcarbamoyladenosine biosynthesis protein TsaB